MQANPSPEEAAKKEEQDRPPFAWFIEMVDSRFLEYDKPMTLALVIGTMTLILGIVILVVTLSIESHTSATALTFLQYYGSYDDQRTWAGMVTSEGTSTVTENNVETTVETELCIRRILMQVPEPNCLQSGNYCPDLRFGGTLWSKSMTFWSQAAGQLGIPYLQPCWPGDDFLYGATLNTNVEPAKWNDDQYTERVLSLCPGVYENYQVSAMAPDPNDNNNLISHSVTGGTNIKNLKNVDPNFDWLEQVTCSPTTGANGPIPWIAEWKQTVTTKSTIKPTFIEALGTAFAYAAYIQVVLTAIIVNSMLLSGSLKQTGENSIDDSATMQEIAMEMGKRATGGK